MKWLSRVLGIASVVFTAIPWTIIAIGSSRTLLRIFSTRALLWIDLNGNQMAGLFGLAILLSLLAAVCGSRLWAWFGLVPFVSFFLLMAILNRQERARPVEIGQKGTQPIILTSIATFTSVSAREGRKRDDNRGIPADHRSKVVQASQVGDGQHVGTK